MVDSFFSRDWYVFFKNIIETQWKDGEAIRSEKEFEELYQKLKGNIDGKEKRQLGRGLDGTSCL